MLADPLALAGLAVLLGVRHGLDADHLAAVDSLTRHNLVAAPQWARASGVLFSLGHGTVVMGVALAGAAVQTSAQAPDWLHGFGALASALILLTLGLLNLQLAWRGAGHSGPDAVRPVGLKSRLLGAAFGRLMRAQHPVAVIAVGAVFALSFDTVSQALLFAASPHGHGLGAAAGLAGLFVLGMVVADGLNGWWVARLVGRADRAAVRAKRVMALLIGALSLLVGALGLMRLVSANVDDSLEMYGLGLSAAVAATVLLGAWLTTSRRRLAQVGCPSVAPEQHDSTTKRR
jgi:nickel/cobalt transporter (NiCoT) family protein